MLKFCVLLVLLLIEASGQRFTPSIKNPNRPFRFTITNDLVDTVKIQWVDYQGNLRDSTTLRSRGQFTENSYFDHSWVLESTRGDQRQFTLGKGDFQRSNAVYRVSQLNIVSGNQGNQVRIVVKVTTPKPVYARPDNTTPRPVYARPDNTTPFDWGLFYGNIMNGITPNTTPNQRPNQRQNTRPNTGTSQNFNSKFYGNIFKTPNTTPNQRPNQRQNTRPKTGTSQNFNQRPNTRPNQNQNFGQRPNTRPNQNQNFGQRQPSNNRGGNCKDKFSGMKANLIRMRAQNAPEWEYLVKQNEFVTFYKNCNEGRI